MCSVWSKLYGVDTVCLRYFNVYSPDQKANGPYATAVSNWMQHIREGKNPFITGDGEQRRDMCHKLDVVSANLHCMKSLDNFEGAWYDIGTGDNISLNEVKAIAQKYFPDCVFDYIESRKGDVMFTKADTSKTFSIGWSPKYTISQGINECFNNLRNEMEGSNEEY